MSLILFRNNNLIGDQECMTFESWNTNNDSFV